MIRTTDQTGRQIEIPELPERIVSLVPSQTELLDYLGLENRVTGITKFCIHPEEWLKQKQRVGGTKILKYNTIKDLNPDLIIANKEENTRESIEKLNQEFPVWVSDVNTLDDALEMIAKVGEITSTQVRANELIQSIKTSFEELSVQRDNLTENKRVLYLIWRKPYMAVGRQTFINDMLERCGFINCLEEGRYPELKEADIVRLAPDLVFFSSEPYPFKEHHMQTLQKILPHSNLQLVDGEPFSWYGSRLLQSVPYFNKLIETVCQKTV